MASFAGMSLGTSAGGAFELARAPRDDAVQAVDGWTVEVRRGVEAVVARGGHEVTYEAARDAALAVAQRGLDLLSVRGLENLGIQGPDNDHLVWWPGPDGLTLRCVSLAWLRPWVSVPTVVVRDAQGTIVPQPPVPPLGWHESFRYFRLSQISSDLFDAYRNLYLALEAVLSTVAPPLPATGGKYEGEGAWFRRALSEAGRRVSLAAFVAAGADDPVAALYDDLYVRTRSAMSHAKAGRSVLLPHEHAERDAVLASLGRLSRLFLALAEAVLGARRLSGGMTTHAMRTMAGALEHDLRLWASDDETPFAPDQRVVNPGGGGLIPVDWQPVPQDRGPLLWAALGRVPGGDLHPLPHITRVAGSNTAGEALFATVLKGPLQHEGLVLLEVFFGVRGANARAPRSDYLT